jgi:hypothetical protein
MACMCFQQREPRLKARSTNLPILLEAADIGIFFAAQMIVPFFFFLRKRRVEGGGLATVEVRRGAFEEGRVACYENVFDG